MFVAFCDWKLYGSVVIFYCSEIIDSGLATFIGCGSCPSFMIAFGAWQHCKGDSHQILERKKIIFTYGGHCLKI